MCGIVGIIGEKGVAPDIIDALRRLEYRGYDSAGLAVLEKGEIEVRRAIGKLENLREKTKSYSTEGFGISIGHT
ncbi:MAG: glutamine--fructose-6-phosphate aminotransferase, partial [Hyphomicrobiaceae bacterium]|nr:glutamine--fructose-6-phosphate aminotransferase [Hyphomicrobiaceae bacterium]